MKIFNTSIRTEPLMSEEKLTELIVMLYPRKALKDIKAEIKKTKLYQNVQKTTNKSKTRKSEAKSDVGYADDIQ